MKGHHLRQLTNGNTMKDLWN